MRYYTANVTGETLVLDRDLLSVQLKLVHEMVGNGLETFYESAP